MRTDLDIIDLLYDKLKLLKGSISGGIYKLQRPLNSTKEDIVINSLPLSDNVDTQTGTFNINIHVPDLNVKINGNNQKQPDTTRLNALNKLVRELLKETYTDDYNVWIEWEDTIKDLETTHNHYKNLRIRFLSYKAYFQN